MIIQVIYHPEEFTKDINKSLQLGFNISGIEKDQLEILSNICNQSKIKLETHNSTFPDRNNLFIPVNEFKKKISEFDSGGLKDLSHEIKKSLFNFENYNQQSVIIGSQEFRSTVIMGILNVTPDSFSDGGKYYDKKTAVEYAIKMFDDGADIVDVGGESTRPGSDPVSEEEELRRVIPVIEEILQKKPEALISVDTTKSKVARKACKAGAKIINDISGLTFNQELADIAKEFSVSLVIMHIKGIPKTMQVKPVYDDLIFEIYEHLHNQIEIAKNKGVENIIVDPGIGFGKRIEDNFEIIRRVGDFKSLGYPILIGLSRKSFLGKTLNLNIKERDNATMVSEAIAIRNGAKIIRTHNIENAVRTKKLLNYIFPN